MKANNFCSLVAGTWCALLVLCAAAPTARAEGGAGPEAMTMGNMCMVMFGYDMIHITSYLPGMSRSEYCRRSRRRERHHGLRYREPKFRDLPIEIRIIRDPLRPVSGDTKLDPLTEVRFPATRYRTGTFSFEHDYKNNGHYIGMVTLTKENGEQETQIFKFSVGETLLAVGSLHFRSHTDRHAQLLLLAPHASCRPQRTPAVS